MGYMYILECSDRTLYVGSTRNLEARLWQHQEGEGAQYTQTRRPVRLLYYEQSDRVEDAYRREKQVQGWSRSKRLALVHGQLENLPGLSRKKFKKPAGGTAVPAPDLQVIE
jgi:putative endonuclease